MSGFGEIPMESANHRLLWIDVDAESLFGFLPSSPDTCSDNFLPMNDPIAIQRLNNWTLREQERHKIPAKLYALKQKALDGTFLPANQLQYDQILTLDHGICQKDQKHCRTFYTGHVPYSNVVSQDRKEIHLWRLLTDRRNGRRSNTRTIRHLMSQTGCNTAMQLTLPNIELAQQACWTRYKDNKQQAEKLRLQFATKVNK